MNYRVFPSSASEAYTKEQPLKFVVLSKKYPVSARYVFRASFRSYVITSLLIVLGGMVRPSIIDHLPFDQPMAETVFFIALVCFPIVYCIGKTIYHYLQRRYLEFGIEEGNFYLKRGIILTARGSFPLSKISEIYIDQNLVDAILDMRNVHLSTRSVDSHTFARIGGIRSRDAQLLKQTLERLAHTQRVQEMQGVMFDSEQDLRHQHGPKGYARKLRNVELRTVNQRAQ